MDIFKHGACNQVLGKPSDMGADDCGSLPIYTYTDVHGPWAMSFWLPTAEELVDLNRGVPVTVGLRVVGRSHPVMFVSTAHEADGKIMRPRDAVFTFDDQGFKWSYNNNNTASEEIAARPAGFSDQKAWYDWAGAVVKAVRLKQPEMGPRPVKAWLYEEKSFGLENWQERSSIKEPMPGYGIRNIRPLYL